MWLYVPDQPPKFDPDQETSLALCAGVGMLDEGLRFGLEFYGRRARTVGYVERDSYAAATLVARMAEAALDQAPIWDDLESFDGRAWRGGVDWLTAGFPCQPWSTAGQRRGTADDRWLWPAIVRLIVDMEPRGIFLENVPGLITGGGLAHVLSDLARLGFAAEWTTLAARDVGASMLSDRVFIVATAECEKRQRWREPGVVANASGTPQGPTGKRQWDGGAPGDQGQVVVATEGVGREQDASAVREGQPNCRRAGEGIFPPAFNGDWGGVPAHLLPEIESGLRLVAPGLALVVDEGRRDQIRCSGNGVVPLQAAAAFVGLVRRLIEADGG